MVNNLPPSNSIFNDWRTILLIWMILFRVAIYVEFGVIYFILSLFFLIWRFGFRKHDNLSPEELSAYSVFNPACERLEGTFSAEDFERSLRSGRIIWWSGAFCDINWCFLAMTECLFWSPWRANLKNLSSLFAWWIVNCVAAAWSDGRLVGVLGGLSGFRCLLSLSVVKYDTILADELRLSGIQFVRLLAGLVLWAMVGCM